MAEQSSTGQALTPASRNALQPAIGSYANASGPMGWLSAFIKQPAVARAMPLIIMSAVVLAAITVWLVLREPPQRDLFRGLPDNDKSAVMQALQVANIAYEVDDDTGTLTVSKEDYHSAKIELAGQGLPRSAPSGDTIMSSMPMGASRAVESEKLRNAREMDLARSIEAIDSVVSARVHLAVEQPSIFLRDRNEPSASVILHLASSTRLDEKETQAILNLVASSVPGLSASNVSVIDQNGRLLSSNSEGLSSGSDTQLKVKAAIEDRYRQSLASLLTPLVGPGNFVAEVTADVNFDEKQATSETYPLDGSVLRSEQGQKSNEIAGNAAGGIPGALANRPPDAAEVAEQPGGAEEEGANAAEPRRTSEEYRRNFELAREVAVTNQAPGQVSRLSVAVAIDDRALKNKKSPKEIQEIEKLIKGTVGYSLGRGDQIAVTARRFKAVADDPIAETWYETSWFSMLIRNLSALLVALLLIFGIGRPVLKRWQTSEKALRSDKNQKALTSDGVTTDGSNQDGTEDGGSLENQTAGALGPPVTIDMITSAKSYQERAVLTQNFVKQNPDHAALVVKELLKESDKLEEVDG
ncbi:flagellar basal-body MS-ring/collar protein FliF [uncultured Parasphingorhabdus sp.]|uniref:flagellar basal-body MS-ring/collar protein FliF n=1 Tax=uncultured Parasphingorhabdus sp. TaxID=2709694 RepID=UPI0030D793A1|tara:strand:+ start:6113 stop:7861 length:1749 start_codon:yes stop_codon:yes gene_type:complete